MLDFRWVAGLTLWTVLSGPVLVELGVIGRSQMHNRNVPVVHHVPLAVTPETDNARLVRWLTSHE